MSAPTYSIAGAGNRDLFLDYRNSVLFYFEDAGREEFYVRLLRRLGFDGVFEDVFCLGGKSEVTKRHRELAPEGKRRVFVLDKDFDDLTGEVYAGAGIVYLGRYSIENYFIDEDLLIEFAVSMTKALKRRDAQEAFGFVDFMSALISWYEGVCRLFVVSRQFRLKGVSTTKVRGNELCDPQTGERKAQWWDAFQRSFYERLRLEQAWVNEDGHLDRLLDEALTPKAGVEHIADGSGMAHFAGKQILEVLIDRLCEKFKLGDVDERLYQYLMISVGSLNDSSAQAIRGRISEALR